MWSSINYTHLGRGGSSRLSISVAYYLQKGDGEGVQIALQLRMTGPYTGSAVGWW